MFNACSQRPLRTRYCEAFARCALDPVRHKKRKRTLWEDFCAKPVTIPQNASYCTILGPCNTNCEPHQADTALNIVLIRLKLNIRDSTSLYSTAAGCSSCGARAAAIVVADEAEDEASVTLQSTTSGCSPSAEALV